MTIAEVAAWCSAQHLRPIVDAELDAVLADCPTCRGQDEDPAGLWRPQIIAPRERRIYIYCQGCDEATVQLRLLRPPTEAEVARHNAQRMKGEGR